MAESNSKLSPPLQKFATDLKAVLKKTEDQIRELRAREASTKARPLQKHELCPLCGGPDVNGRCKCIEGLQKNAMMGYGGPTPSPAPANAQGGLGSSGGGGTQPMGLSEGAIAKAEMCKACGYEHMAGKHGERMEKKTPPDISEKTMHKLKDEYGHDEKGKEKAFATAWAIHNKTVKKSTMDGEVAGGAVMAKMGMPTSSAAALAPKPSIPHTPVGQVNAELGGAKSVFGAGQIGAGSMKMVGAPKPLRTPVHAMGRPTVAVSGEIANAKSELGSNPGSASKYGTGGPGHATQTNMPSALKASMAPTAKAELPVVKPAPEKSVKGAKAPPAKGGKKQDTKKQGSGGEILKKAAPALALVPKAPAGKGVAGKQPVGQGGGDAHKVAATAKLPPPGAPNKGAKLPGPAGSVGAGPTKPVAAPAKGGTFNQRLEATAAKKAAMQQGTLGQRLALNPAPAKAAGPDALQGVRDQLNLAADKKAGGVGFLRGLMSMFHSPKPAAGAPQQQGQKTSARFHGAMPLQRGEKEPVKEAPKVEAPKPTEPKITSKRFHGALPLRRNEDLKKAALSLTKKDLEVDELDKGLNSTNHNRTMLSIKPKRQGVKKSR